jgi:hypothetical protein
MIVMGARGYKPDGSGGEIAVYWNERARLPLLLLAPNRFSYWLFNAWSNWVSRLGLWPPA